jgi:Holliday junction resolvase RusA-like endonuclease
MARQRSAFPAPAVFEYVVPGTPVSAQPQSRNRERKDPKLPRWREKIRAAIQDAIQQRTGLRGYELHIDPMRIQIVWFTDDLSGRPDLDNIAKPFLDGLIGLVVHDDLLFHEVHLRKVELNHQFEPEPNLVFDAKAGSLTEFVYVRVERLEWDQPTRLERAARR